MPSEVCREDALCLLSVSAGHHLFSLYNKPKFTFMQGYYKTENSISHYSVNSHTQDTTALWNDYILTGVHLSLQNRCQGQSHSPESLTMCLLNILHSKGNVRIMLILQDILLTHWHTQTSLRWPGSLGPLIHSRL